MICGIPILIFSCRYLLSFPCARSASVIYWVENAALHSATCSMDVQMVKGVKNVFLGGEGLFNTVVTGPGTISLQTMPAYQVANSIRPYIPTRTD